MKEMYCGICWDIHCTAGMEIENDVVLGRWINKRGENSLVKSDVTIEECPIRKDFFAKVNRKLDEGDK